MTRVSTLSQQQSLLNTILQNQSRVFERNNQIATGNRSDTYQGISRNVETLQTAKSIRARTETFLDGNKDLNRRLQIYDVALQGIYDVAQELRLSIIDAINTNSGLALRDKINDLYDTAASLLNTKDGGNFVFGGTRTDTQPVTADDTAALAALGFGNHAQAFVNNSIRAQTKIDESRTLTYGFLASTVATDLFDVVSRLVTFDNGTNAQGFAPAGSFNDPLNTNQRNFLSSLLDEATTAANTVNNQVALNGVNLKTLEDTQTRHKADLVFSRIFIGDIEDIDAAEAISKLNLDQLALESSFRVFGQLTRLTLLDVV